jgi:hypothetical protein
MTLHYQTNVGVGGSEPSAATMLTKINDHYSSSGHNLSKFTACLDTGCGLTRSSVYERVTPGSGDVPASAVETHTLAGSLTASSDRNPAGIATWIKLTTAAAGRSFRGGTHVPGSFQPADFDLNGFWQGSGTFWTAVVALAAAILDDINDIDVAGTDLQVVIYSHVRDARGLDATEPITAAVPSTTPRFVRSRMFV